MFWKVPMAHPRGQIVIVTLAVGPPAIGDPKNARTVPVAAFTRVIGANSGRLRLPGVPFMPAAKTVEGCYWCFHSTTYLTTQACYVNTPVALGLGEYS